MEHFLGVEHRISESLGDFGDSRDEHAREHGEEHGGHHASELSVKAGRGNAVMKAGHEQEFSARKGPEGNEAGLQGSGHNEHRSGNPIEAAHTNLPQGNGNAAGFHCPGQNSHRGGNCIKALHFFFSQRTAQMMMSLASSLSKVLSTALSMSSVFIEMGSADGTVSNLNVGGAL